MRAPVRVMIVEDSLVVRHLLTHIVTRDPRLTVAVAVASAEEALRELPRVRPDVISMDIRLPGMDGLEATRVIMAQHPTPIVVIADAVEDASLRISMNALRAGALTVVEKPVGVGNAAYEGVAQEICTQLFIMSQVPVIRRRNMGRPPVSASSRIASFSAALAEEDSPAPSPSGRVRSFSVLAIGTSTGGPPALAKILGGLAEDFPLPVLIVQHMGAPFMEGFAGWLDKLVPMRVGVAIDRQLAQPGHAYVAPGGRHLRFDPQGRLRVDDDAAIGGQKPAATALFRSVAEAAGERGLGVLLTGMGEDGAAGLVDLRKAGGHTITEDESTAVVYGMPAAAVRMGGSSLSLPLGMIAPHLNQLLGRQES